MEQSTARLARSITQKGSRQTYWTARLLVDNERMDDFYRAYAYFRWADDIIDSVSRSNAESVAFARRQRELIERLYRHEPVDGLATEEAILADLIRNDGAAETGLQSFIRNMLAVIEFDAYRRGRTISQQELDWYTERLAASVTDGLQYFIGRGHLYRSTKHRLSAASAAHVTHLLRDTLQDVADGFFNIPREYLEAHAIGPEEIDSLPYRAWVRQRVEWAHASFFDGKRYLDELDVLRCKIAGYWYCMRFEGVLNTIERDGYRLRPEYKHHKLFTWTGLIGVSIAVTLRHVYRRSRRVLRHEEQ